MLAGKLLLLHFDHAEKRLRKIRLISKFMTSQPGKQTIAIYILSNTWRNKGKQTMKFGQLLEHNTKNNFLEKS